MATSSSLRGITLTAAQEQRAKTVHEGARRAEVRLDEHDARGWRIRRLGLRALEHELVALVDRSRTLDPADCTEADTCHILNREMTTESSYRAGRRSRR